MKALATRKPSQPARPAAGTAGMSATPMPTIYRLLSMSTPGTGQTEGADEQCASRSPDLARTTRLPVSNPDDPHEREADRVADAVMRSPSHSCEGCPADAPCTECADQHTVHRTPSVSEPSSTASPTSTRGGRPLDKALRAQFEPRFGADFGAVRIHTGRLLARELTHVVQQSAQSTLALQRQAPPTTVAARDDNEVQRLIDDALARNGTVRAASYDLFSRRCLPENCLDENLAAAEHYMVARNVVEASTLPPEIMAAIMSGMISFYQIAKQFDLWPSSCPDICPVTPSSTFQFGWGMTGVGDALIHTAIPSPPP